MLDMRTFIIVIMHGLI